MKTPPGPPPGEPGQQVRSLRQRITKRLNTNPDYPELQAPKRVNLLVPDCRTSAPASPAAPADCPASPPTSVAHSPACSPPRAYVAPAAYLPSPESPAKGPYTPSSAHIPQAFFAGVSPQHPGLSTSPPPENVYSPHYGTKPAYSQSSAHAASAPNTAFTPYPAVFPLSLPSPYIPTIPYTSSSPSTASITHVVPSHHAVPPPFFASTPHAAAANPLTPTADPSVAYVPGSFVAGVPFETLPLYHQNFILKAATHCWKDQYAELQLDNNKLRAGLASSQGQHASLEERLQLLEEQLETQRQWKTAVDSASHDE